MKTKAPLNPKVLYGGMAGLLTTIIIAISTGVYTEDFYTALATLVVLLLPVASQAFLSWFKIDPERIELVDTVQRLNKKIENGFKP